MCVGGENTATYILVNRLYGSIPYSFICCILCRIYELRQKSFDAFSAGQMKGFQNSFILFEFYAGRMGPCRTLFYARSSYPCQNAWMLYTRQYTFGVFKAGHKKKTIPNSFDVFKVGHAKPDRTPLT